MPATNPIAFGVFDATGRMAGCYVYMLFCQDEGPIYVKIGISEHPTKRLHALRTTCAVTPQTFAVIEVRSRRIAQLIERKLHLAYKAWQTTGEWFAFQPEQKGEFKTKWKETIASFDTDKTRPLKWTFVAVPPIQTIMDKRRAYFQRKKKKKGRAFADFKRACAK